MAGVELYIQGQGATAENRGELSFDFSQNRLEFRVVLHPLGVPYRLCQVVNTASGHVFNPPISEHTVRTDIRNMTFTYDLNKDGDPLYS